MSEPALSITKIEMRPAFLFYYIYFCFGKKLHCANFEQLIDRSLAIHLCLFWLINRSVAQPQRNHTVSQAVGMNSNCQIQDKQPLCYTAWRLLLAQQPTKWHHGANASLIHCLSLPSSWRAINHRKIPRQPGVKMAVDKQEKFHYLSIINISRLPWQEHTRHARVLKPIKS